jgi:hypothetical protein
MIVEPCMPGEPYRQERRSQRAASCAVIEAAMFEREGIMRMGNRTEYVFAEMNTGLRRNSVGAVVMVCTESGKCDFPGLYP